MATKRSVNSRVWEQSFERYNPRGSVVTLNALLADFAWTGKNLSQNDSPFARRAFARTIFSTLEGVLWTLKQCCLTFPDHLRKNALTPGDFAALSDQSYELNPKGKVLIRPKFLRLADNLYYTFRLIGECYDVAFALGGSVELARLNACIEIRNRITHPKSALDLEISDAEIEEIKALWRWIMYPIRHSMEAIVKVRTDMVTQVINKKGKELDPEAGPFGRLPNGPGSRAL